MSSKLKYALLLDNVKGYRILSTFINKDSLGGELLHVIFSKGSLLVKLNKQDISAFKKTYGCNVNYAVYSIASNDSYLLVGNHIVHTITTEQKDFLYGIERHIERIEVYKNLEWIEKITVGSKVYVTISTTPYPVKGVVRWIGKLLGEYGKKFGIELLENTGEGSQETCDGVYNGQYYFSCKATNCAVFVAMDKLTDPQSADAAKKLRPTQLLSGKNEIKLGNLVAFYDGSNFKHKGTVRWIGSADSDAIIGIEVESKVTKDVPHSISGMSHYFSAKKSHSKIFLPIGYVYKDSPPVKDSSSPHSKLDFTGETVNHSHFENVQAMSPGYDKPKEQYDAISPILEHNTFKIGSEIMYDGHYGIIKWIGKPPGSNILMAGLEMFEKYVVDEAEDGYWKDQFLYECAPMRGMFAEFDRIQLAEIGGKQRVPQDKNISCANLISIQAPMTPENQVKSQSSDNFSSPVDQSHQNMHETIEENFRAVEELMKNCLQKSEESVQRMEDNAPHNTLEVQNSNKELQVSNIDAQNKLSLTQQQLSDLQRSNMELQAISKGLQTSNEHLQSQILTILDKMSHTQQQLLDVQKSNEELQKANTYLQDQLSLTKEQLIHVQKNNELSQAKLQNQLSLTQQQLLGVQSMITCSRLWVISHDQFEIGKEIGRGAWASVHESTFRGAKVAAKRLHDEITSPETIELFHREMKMALHCQHQNIVTFLGVTLEYHPVILMELMDISLRSAYKRGNLECQQIYGILHNIASALHFLHTRPDPVIHRDVSSANVLLKDCGDEKWLAKLGDLGTAKIQQHITTPGPGALAYAAPEVADPERHTTKMDVYSFGVLVIEVLTKTLPFQNLNTLKAQVQLHFPLYHQLVTSCTHQQSSDRPTMYEVIEQLNKIPATVA